MYFVFRSCFLTEFSVGSVGVVSIFTSTGFTFDQWTMCIENWLLTRVIFFTEVHWDQLHVGRQCKATFQVSQMSPALPCLAFLGANAFTQAPFHCLPMRKFEICSHTPKPQPIANCLDWAWKELGTPSTQLNKSDSCKVYSIQIQIQLHSLYIQ